MLARGTDQHREVCRAATRSVFWASVWLAIVLVAAKAYYLTLPGSVRWADGFSLRLLAAISYADVLFAAVWWAGGRAALALAGDRRLAARAISFTFVACSALACLYAVANVMLYGAMGGFLTYQLLALVGDVGMLRSSAAAYMTPRALAGLVCLPLGYVALVHLAVRGIRPWSGARWVRRSVALASSASG